jgi:hypothetical protein
VIRQTERADMTYCCAECLINCVEASKHTELKTLSWVLIKDELSYVI